MNNIAKFCTQSMYGKYVYLEFDGLSLVREYEKLLSIIEEDVVVFVRGKYSALICA